MHVAYMSFLAPAAASAASAASAAAAAAAPPGSVGPSFEDVKKEAATAYFEGETWYLRMSFLSKIVLATTIFLGYLLPDAADGDGESWIKLVSDAIDTALAPGDGRLTFFVMGQ